jgi:hypothetical protein
MFALGQKQTFAPQKGMSALPPKADMCGATKDVRYGPKADIRHWPLVPQPVIVVSAVWVCFSANWNILASFSLWQAG